MRQQNNNNPRRLPVADGATFYPSPSEVFNCERVRERTLSAAVAVGMFSTIAGVGWYLLKSGLIAGAIGGAGAVGSVLIAKSLLYDTQSGHLAKTNEYNAKRLSGNVAPTSHVQLNQRSIWMKAIANIGIFATAVIGIAAAIGLTISTAGVGTIIGAGLLSAGLRLLASREQYIYQKHIKEKISAELQVGGETYDDNKKLKTAMTIQNRGPDFYNIRKFFEGDKVKVGLMFLAGAAILGGVASGGVGLLAVGGVAMFLKAAGLIGAGVLLKGVQQEYQTHQLALDNEAAGQQLGVNAPRTQARLMSRGHLMKQAGKFGVVVATFLGIASAVGLSVASFGVGAIVAGGIMAASLYFLGAREQRMEQEFTRDTIFSLGANVMPSAPEHNCLVPA